MDWRQVHYPDITRRLKNVSSERTFSSKYYAKSRAPASSPSRVEEPRSEARFWFSWAVCGKILCSLDKMTPWIFMVFVPLIRVALKAYNEFRPGETQRKAKRARASVPDAGEIQMLQRMKNLQLAKKPAKPTTLSIQDVAGTSSDSSDDDDEEEDESTREESASTSSSSASSVTPPRHGRGKTRPWTSAFVLPVDPGALLPPSAGALPPPFTLEGVVEDKPSEREETGVAGPNRSPLTPRNLKDARAGSASPSGFGARVSLFPDRSPTQSSPSDCPSSPASLVSSFKENLLLG
ncbi:hypothetical protein DFH06DRAFT_306601 [Mycena polygramma]|nr:hypothetical protein DFH06DRAFT_306601 [Mycena polygramma]